MILFQVYQTKILNIPNLTQISQNYKNKKQIFLEENKKNNLIGIRIKLILFFI